MKTRLIERRPEQRISTLASRWSTRARQPLRVLMIASEAPPTHSGIARTIESLVDRLRQRGHHVDVVAHPDIPRIVLGEMRLYGLPMHLPRIGKSLDAYDVIHLHGAVPTVSDAFLLYAGSRSRRRPPLVYTHHCDIDIGKATLLTGVYNRIHRQLSRIADVQVSTTRGYAAQIGLPDATRIVPLGIDADRFASDSQKDAQFTVLFAGQFRPYKGVPVLLRAMAQVRGARLLLAGRGREEQSYRALAQRLGLDVEFHVNADDRALQALFARAHVVVLPSVTEAEAFGLVLVEGMAAGCVPVASDLPGVRDVLGRIGFTFPRGSLSGLAGVLRMLRDRPLLVQNVAERARLRASEFSWDRTAEDYDRLYRDLVFARAIERQGRPVELTAETYAREVSEHLRSNLRAKWAGVMVPDSDGYLRIVAQASDAFDGSDTVDQATAHLVASRAFVSHESVLAQAGTRPRLVVGAPLRVDSSAMAVPLRVDGRPVGVLACLREAPFDPRDGDAVEQLARCLEPVLQRPGFGADESVQQPGEVPLLPEQLPA